MRTYKPRKRPATPRKSATKALWVFGRSAAFCRPVPPDVAAAPAAPVGTAVSVTGAFTTTIAVLVVTEPSGAVE